MKESKRDFGRALAGVTFEELFLLTSTSITRYASRKRFVEEYLSAVKVRGAPCGRGVLGTCAAVSATHTQRGD